MELFDFAWGLMLVPLGVIWKALTGVQSAVGEHDKDIIALKVLASESEKGRTAVFKNLGALRTDLTSQHETLRTEMREDAKETRRAIAAISK